jgi:hypothetical protein
MIRWSTVVACNAQLLLCCLTAYNSARVMAARFMHLLVLLLHRAAVLPLVLKFLCRCCAITVCQRI